MPQLSIVELARNSVHSSRWGTFLGCHRRSAHCTGFSSWDHEFVSARGALFTASIMDMSETSIGGHSMDSISQTKHHEVLSGS